VAAALVPPVALMTFILVTRMIGWDRGAIAAGGFAVLALTAFVALAATALGGRGAPVTAPPDPNPYRQLRVLPAADQALATIAYRHLLRVASARSDSAALDALESAFARVGTPAARTAYDLRAAETDALMLAEPVEPVAPARPRRAHATPLRPLCGAALSAVYRLRRRRPADADRQRPVARWEAFDGVDGVLPQVTPEPAVPSIGILQVLEGEREIVTVVLRDSTVYAIGSAPDADVRLPVADDVAAEHARLTVRRGRVLFHHVAEGADSFINGERAVWAVLETGDTLRIGANRCQYLIAPTDPRSASFLRDLPRE
jgi:hypothetical protein